MTMLIAHRGVSDIAPENSHAAFRLAWTLDCAGIELDVQVSQDGQVVVCHDETLERTGKCNLRIDQCQWAEMKDIDIGSFKSPEYAQERLPLLTDVLAEMPTGKTIQVEIKPEVSHLEPIIHILRQCRRDIHLYVMSFNRELLSAIQQAVPDLPTLYLVDYQDAQNPTQLIHETKSRQFTGLDIHHQAVTPEFYQLCRQAELLLGVWTVDDITEAERLIHLGVDMIASNRPHTLTSDKRNHHDD